MTRKKVMRSLPLTSARLPLLPFYTLDSPHLLSFDIMYSEIQA
ncbi:hypothetical protein ACQCT3_07990 [Sutcliffiella horikoshii]